MAKQKPLFFTHKTAVVDKGAKIGPETKIWHFSHVMGSATIGEKCVLGQNVFVGSNVTIGNYVKIQNNVSVFDGVMLEDYVFCGPSMTFTNVNNPRSHLEKKDEFQKTLVKKGATIGAHATVLCGTTIGSYAFVGAGSVVTKDVPAHALVMGTPARQRGWMCDCGVRLEPVKNHLTCSSCQNSYQLTKEGLILA